MTEKKDHAACWQQDSSDCYQLFANFANFSEGWQSTRRALSHYSIRSFVFRVRDFATLPHSLEGGSLSAFVLPSWDFEKCPVVGFRD